MTDMTLARIRELNKNRTPGEWARDSFGVEAGGDYLIGPDREGGLRFNSDHANLELDLNFIAAAPTMIEYLLSVVDEVRELHNPARIRGSVVCAVRPGAPGPATPHGR